MGRPTPDQIAEEETRQVFLRDNASRLRRKAALTAELKELNPGGGDPLLDQQRHPTPREVGQRRQWLLAELDKLADLPLLGFHELKRLP